MDEKLYKAYPMKCQTGSTSQKTDVKGWRNGHPSRPQIHSVLGYAWKIVY